MMPKGLTHNEIRLNKKSPNWSLKLKTLSLWKKLRDSEKITKIVK